MFSSRLWVAKGGDFDRPVSTSSLKPPCMSFSNGLASAGKAAVLSWRAGIKQSEDSGVSARGVACGAGKAAVCLNGCVWIINARCDAIADSTRERASERKCRREGHSEAAITLGTCRIAPHCRQHTLSLHPPQFLPPLPPPLTLCGTLTALGPTRRLHLPAQTCFGCRTGLPIVMTSRY